MGKCVACKGIWADRELLDTLLESAQVQSHAGTPEAGSSTGALRHVSKGSGPDKGARGCGMHWSSLRGVCLGFDPQEL